MKKLLLILAALIKFLACTFASMVILVLGSYTTWAYYSSDLATHWVFSFGGPMMLIASIGMAVIAVEMFHREVRDAT